MICILNGSVYRQPCRCRRVLCVLVGCCCKMVSLSRCAICADSISKHFCHLGCAVHCKTYKPHKIRVPVDNILKNKNEKTSCCWFPSFFVCLVFQFFHLRFLPFPSRNIYVVSGANACSFRAYCERVCDKNVTNIIAFVVRYEQRRQRRRRYSVKTKLYAFIVLLKSLRMQNAKKVD